MEVITVNDDIGRPIGIGLARENPPGIGRAGLHDERIWQVTGPTTLVGHCDAIGVRRKRVRLDNRKQFARGGRVTHVQYLAA